MHEIILETRQVSKHFGGLKAVDGVSLQVQAGTLHSIIGPNGAGKTTFFNLLSGTLKPTSGQVLLRGRDISHTPVHRMAHLGLGRSFQITNIFPNLTVLENVRLSVQALGSGSLKFWQDVRRFPQYSTRAHAVIEQVGLGDRAHMPALTLPHGDKRKLELAILLAADPAVLLLDEPTAGMASEQVPHLMDVIHAIRQQGSKTVLLVEHRMDVVMQASDRITVMHQGRILADGAPAEIAANEMVQQAYLGGLYRSAEKPEMHSAV